MNALELFAHATNTDVTQKTAEEFLEDVEGGSEQELRKALAYYAGYNVLDVEEAEE